jgi:hypothetical protein
MKRRSFLYNSTLATTSVFIGLHDLLASCSSSSTGNILTKISPRILHLDLVTATPIAELKTFYTDLLELPLLSEQADRFMIQAGETTINFVQVKENVAAPFYHFAFNIPENKILKAREWQLKRTTLSATPTQLIDEKFPKDIRHFQHWNAHSIFFWDPAGNLVEYIARHDLDNSADGEFTSKDLLCASEIAFIVNDANVIADELRSSFSLDQYKGGDDNFRAIGDENGLLLIIKKGRVWESHTNISRTPDTIKTSVMIKADKTESWKPANYPFEINVKA